MAESLFDKIMSAYQQDYFEKSFEQDGESGPVLFEVMLERCRAYFQIAVRQAYLDYRGTEGTGEIEFAKFLAKALLTDVQFKDSISGKKAKDPEKQPKDLRPLAKKLFSGSAAGNKRDIAYELYKVTCDDAYTTKLTWKQLVALANEMFEAAGALPQTLKDAPLFEEYRLSLECQEYQKAHQKQYPSIKGETFRLSYYEELQHDGEVSKTKKFDKAQKAIAKGELLFGTKPKDVFAYLRIDELKKVCEAWTYDRGYSAAGRYAEFDKKKKKRKTEVISLESMEAPGRTDYLARATKIDIPFIERYNKALSTDESSSAAFDDDTKKDIDTLIKDLEDDNFKQVSVPLHIDSKTGTGLYLVDTETVGSATHIRSPYALIVASLEAASSFIVNLDSLEDSQAEAFSTDDKELAYMRYAALVNGESDDDVAVTLFRDTNTSFGQALLDCPRRYKRFFAEV